MTENPAERLPRVLSILPSGTAEDSVELDHAGRFLRRRRLVSRHGLAFLIDLPKAVALKDGAVLQLDSGAQIAVAAAAEPLIEVRGDLPRLAWHIGNRHTPCEIAADHLVIGRDHVLAGMLTQLGAELRETLAPFRPEGGAYGHGRTFGHDHGPAEEEDHRPDHGHGSGADRHHHHHSHDHGPAGRHDSANAPRADSVSGRGHLHPDAAAQPSALRQDFGPRRLNAHFRDRRDERDD